MRKVLILLLTMLSGPVASISAQQWAVKNNLISDANGALNVGVEYALDNKTTLDCSGSIRPWKRTERVVNRYWFVQPEYRHWFCQKFNGHFVGGYANAAQYNIGGWNLPFGVFSNLKKHRYAGWIAGLGATYGYQYPLDVHWNIGASISVGYEYIHYNKYNCPVLCARKVDEGNYHYVGPTRLSLDIIYIF